MRASNLWCVAVLAAAFGFAACGDDEETNGGAEPGGDSGPPIEDSGNGADAGVDPDTSGGADAGGGDTATEGDTAVSTGGYEACFPEFVEQVGVSIDDLGMPVASACEGTVQQNFDGIERVVFLGDSITAGQGGGANGAYRVLLGERLSERYPGVVIDDCSEGGAVNGDLLAEQIPNCFASPEDRLTLVVFTSGGNDVVQLAFNKATLEEATPVIDGFVAELRAALDFLADPANTPGGVRVVYANVYEFTDATGVMSSCPLAAIAGLTGVWEDGVAAYAYMEEQYAALAAEFGFDVMFLEENFCGHGYNRDSPDSPCADRAGDLWIGSDCIHPNVAGHAAIADLFWGIIAGE
ncbi:MAG: SGNH/GDSL hydrolase family protein [Myxococcales bacterium]|nr:SGNH/GDSL hydrolase family protein [Myxococcales bacterium]